MHTGKLSHDIFKPLTISVSGVVIEFFSCLLEEFDLFNQLSLHLAQLDFALGGPLLQLGHLGLHLLYLLLQFNHFVTER